MLEPQTPIEKISRIGPAYRERLKKFRVKTAWDLLLHIPIRYEDFSNITSIATLQAGDEITIQGKITALRSGRTARRHMAIAEATIEDETGKVRAVWFNQPYLAKTFEKGMRLMLSGKVVPYKDKLTFSSPAYEIIGEEAPASVRQLADGGEAKPDKEETIHTGRLVPVYPETLGVSSRWLRGIISSILGDAARWDDALPEEVRKKHGLTVLAEALTNVHFPKSRKDAEEARRRLAFEELLQIQLMMLQEKLKIQSAHAPAIKANIDKTKRIVSSLPFTLTDAQRKAAWRILQDMAEPHPMNRLLEGDVGSGKTMVAVIAAQNVVDAGYQVALMAPTEILAEQHFREFSRHFAKEGIIVGLYTSGNHMRNSMKVLYSPFKISKTKLKKETGEGAVQVLIGTHALLQDSVRFANMGLLIVDEQHRFGVEQRAKLSKKRRGFLVPHLLSMTATPIPRTLALTIYGDLDLSVLDEMPAGRKKIKTKIVPPKGVAEVYQFVRERVKEGRQVYIIYPLIEESEKLQSKAAVKEYENLAKNIFPDLSIGLIHGRLKVKEKQKILDEFKDGKINILVATSVVEVGIDVPNATVIVIEGAERFGLAQLHQFRGRVQRSSHQAYCFLISEKGGGKTRERLSALASTASGFELAEKDLEIRGPGDLSGVRQSGMPDLAMAALANLPFIEEVREEARELLRLSPTLAKWPKLQSKVRAMKSVIHFE